MGKLARYIRSVIYFSPVHPHIGSSFDCRGIIVTNGSSTFWTLGGRALDTTEGSRTDKEEIIETGVRVELAGVCRHSGKLTSLNHRLLCCSTGFANVSLGDTGKREEVVSPWPWSTVWSRFSPWLKLSPPQILIFICFIESQHENMEIRRICIM